MAEGPTEAMSNLGIVAVRIRVDGPEFGKLQIGHASASIRAWHLSNPYIEVTILNYGAIIQKIMVRDRNGQFDDVITGFDDINGYINSPNDMHGAIVGRYANRIGRAEFMLDGKMIKLNSSPWDNNHIHGGTVGFDKKLWGRLLQS